MTALADLWIPDRHRREYPSFKAVCEGTTLKINAKSAKWPSYIPPELVRKVENLEAATRMCETLQGFIDAWAEDPTYKTTGSVGITPK